MERERERERREGGRAKEEGGGRGSNLFAGHELEGAMSAEVKNGVGAEDLLKVRVVGGEAVVGRGALGEEQAHGVPLVAERWLHADEDVAEPLAVNQQVGTVRVEIARRLAARGACRHAPHAHSQERQGGRRGGGEGRDGGREREIDTSAAVLAGINKRAGAVRVARHRLFAARTHAPGRAHTNGGTPAPSRTHTHASKRTHARAHTPPRKYSHIVCPAYILPVRGGGRRGGGAFVE